MVDARSEPEYEPRAHTTTRRLMVTLAARRFSKVRPYSYADARLETRHAQLVPDLPLRLYGAWLTRGPGQNFNPPAPGTPSFMLLAAARAMGRPTRSGAPRSVDSSKGPRPRAWSAASSTSARAPARSRLRTHRSTAPPRRRSTPSPGPSPRSWPRNIRVSDQPRDCGDGRPAYRRLRRERVSETGRGADAVRPHRSAARYRAGRRLPSLRGGRLDHWRNAAHQRR